MPRQFTANFDTVRNRSHVRPYYVLEIAWTSGTVYYVDRDPGQFTAAGLRHPAGAERRVSGWPSIALQLRENQISSVDSFTMELWDGDKAIKALVDADVEQRRPVRLWMLFDDPLTVWPTDAAVLANGSTKPFAFKESTQRMAIQIEDSSARLIQQVGKIATKTDFPQVPPEHRDKPLPILYGAPRRVETVCVDYPWTTSLLEFVPSTVVGATFDVLDHPSDLGVVPGVPVWVVLGNDECRGFFTQSADPLNVPSTFTIDQQDWITLASSRIDFINNAADEIRILKSSIRPMFFDWSQVQVGDPVRIIYPRDGGGRHIRNIDRLRNGEPGPDWVRIHLDNPLPFPRRGLIDFIDPMQERRPWPAGTTLRERDRSYVYIANMLPSEEVNFVEAWGSMVNEGGDNNKQLVVLPKDEIAINVDDNRYAAQLGHNCTTLEMDNEPRQIWPWLDDNRIFTETRGTLVDGGAYGQNPADVLRHLLTDPNMMNIDAAELDAASWLAADLSWQASSTRVSYPITEVRKGLEIAQEIAAQVGAVVQFSGGDAAGGSIHLVLLHNAPPSTSQAIDETTIRQRTLRFKETDVSQLASHVLANWRRDWDGRSGKNELRVGQRNDPALSAHGRNVRQLPLTVFSERDQAQAMVDFFAERWGWVYRDYELTTFLNGLNLLPGDYFDLTFEDGEQNDVVTGETAVLVMACTAEPGGPVKLKVRQRFFDFT